MNALDRWKNALSEATWKIYQINFNNFMNKFLPTTQYAGYTPDRLAELSIPEATDLANAYHQWNVKHNYTPKTAMNRYTTVRSFFAYNYKRLGKTPRGFSDYAMYETSRLITPEEVWQMINAVSGRCVKRNRAILSFWWQSMQRVGIMCSLKFKYISQQFLTEEAKTNYYEFLMHILDTPPLIFEIPAYVPNRKGENVNKRRIKYAFGIGKDACHYLRIHVKQRHDWNEPLNKESWIFREYKQVPKNKPGIPMSPDNFNTFILQPLAEEIEIQNVIPTQIWYINHKGERHQRMKYEIHSHINRRSAKAQYRKAGITDPLFLDFIQGHKLPFNGAYDKFLAMIPQKVRQAEPEISFIPKTDMQYDATVARLQAELNSLSPEVQKQVFAKKYIE